jgi:hypothetical protein
MDLRSRKHAAETQKQTKTILKGLRNNSSSTLFSSSTSISSPNASEDVLKKKK